MKRILLAFLFLGAALSLFIGTPALSSRVSGLTKALEQLPPEDLEEVLENLGVSIIPAIPAPVPKTWQTTIFYSGDDGALGKGVPWPTPRFTDNYNGTVTDNLTGLVWTQNASIFKILPWEDACEACSNLASGEYGLSDGSQAGDWRLPNVRELQSLIDYGKCGPALPEGHPFVGVASFYYWSSTTYAPFAPDLSWGWFVYLGDGVVGADEKSEESYVWCVRGGQ